MERKDFFKKGIFQALKKAVETTEEVYDVIHESVSGKISESEAEEIADTKEYVPEMPEIGRAHV